MLHFVDTDGIESTSPRGSATNEGYLTAEFQTHTMDVPKPDGLRPKQEPVVAIGTGGASTRVGPGPTGRNKYGKSE